MLRLSLGHDCSNSFGNIIMVRWTSVLFSSTSDVDRHSSLGLNADRAVMGSWYATGVDTTLHGIWSLMLSMFM